MASDRQQSDRPVTRTGQLEPIPVPSVDGAELSSALRLVLAPLETGAWQEFTTAERDTFVTEARRLADFMRQTAGLQPNPEPQDVQPARTPEDRAHLVEIATRAIDEATFALPVGECWPHMLRRASLLLRRVAHEVARATPCSAGAE